MSEIGRKKFKLGFHGDFARILMEPFQKYEGKVAILDRADIDTDQIIPKQFLKSIERSGFGKNLFHDWRFLDGDVTRPNPRV